MKQEVFLITLFAILLSFVTACSGQKKEKDAVDSDADTLASVWPHVPTLDELTLPDTLYDSVCSVVYVVENMDSTPRNLKYYDDLYDRSDRVMTFRKNLMRNADFGGRVDGTPSVIEVAWSFDTPYGREETKFGQWGGGTGWTGQPL